MKPKDLLWLAGGAVAIYLLWPKKSSSSLPFPTTVAPMGPSAGSSGVTYTAPNTTVDTSPAASHQLPDTYEAGMANAGQEIPSFYEQQANMSPEDLAQSILTQGLQGYDGGMGEAFYGGWWR